MSVSLLTHFALFEKERCGTSSRTGPPCSIGNGLPSNSHTTHALPPVTCSSGRVVVFPVFDVALTKCASAGGRAASSSVSTLTPANCVSNFDQVVTQWMSPRYSDGGSACASSQV